MNAVKLFLGAGALLVCSCLSAQTGEVKAITQTVLAFVEAGDRQDAKALDQLLHAEYRVVMNQLFGATGASVLPRAAYLDKIQKKEFGGDTRTPEVESVLVNGKNATVRVLLKGKKLTMRSDLILVQDASGTWQLMSDIPTIL